MAITDPLQSRWYQYGWLVQQCNACNWAQRGHTIELVDCPECGTPIGDQVAISFGGLFLSLRRRGFELLNSCGGKAIIQESDVPETIQFLCRHGNDIRNGRVDAPSQDRNERSRRVRWRPRMSDHFDTED
jgi:hypothetical protein